MSKGLIAGLTLCEEGTCVNSLRAMVERKNHEGLRSE